MKVSELILALQQLQAKHGDVVAAIDDADTGWTLEARTVSYDDVYSCICISADYGDRITPRR